MFNRVKSLAHNAALFAGITLVTIGSARADFTVPAEVAAAGVSAALLGTAVLGVLIGIRAFKWIRKAMYLAGPGLGPGVFSSAGLDQLHADQRIKTIMGIYVVIALLGAAWIIFR